MELFHTERKKTTRVLSVIYLIATAVIALGYSVFYVEVALPNGSTGQLLDIMDYISNSFMMPFISLLSAILIGWIMKPSWIAEEMELSGEKFKRKKLYNVIDALYYASHYGDFILAVNRCVESDYEIRIYRNRSLKGSRRNLASFCNLSMWKSQ